MGQRGRKPVPTRLRVLRGDQESRINRDEPVPAEAEVTGIELTDGAQQVWQRLAPELIDKGILTAWDADLFSVFCEATATFHECRRQLTSNYVERGARGSTKAVHWMIMRDCEQIMSRIGSRFGLTPADRAALRSPDEAAPNSGAARLLT